MLSSGFGWKLQCSDGGVAVLGGIDRQLWPPDDVVPWSTRPLTSKSPCVCAVHLDSLKG